MTTYGLFLREWPMPTCWIIAAPNGAGKTTFALNYLPKVAHCHRFLNADLIAAGLSPLAPEQQLIHASRLFLKALDTYIVAQENFAFETTLAGKTYLKLIQRLKNAGWYVELIYLALPSMEMSKMRVAERVAHGGHNIPIKDIERRFQRSLQHLLVDFSSLADNTHCFMNSGHTPQLVFEQNGHSRNIINSDLYHLLLQEANL